MRVHPICIVVLFVSEFRSLRKVWNEIYWLRTLGVLPIGWRRTPWGASRRVHFIPTDLARVRDVQLASFQGQHHVHPPQYQTTHSEPKSKKFPSPFGRKFFLHLIFIEIFMNGAGLIRWKKFIKTLISGWWWCD